MDTPAEELQQYIGRPIGALPTPSYVVSRPILEENCRRMLQDVSEKKLAFRAHVKTLKSAEVTRLMIGPHKKVVASTLREILGLFELVDEGRVDEILYGIPCPPSALDKLYEYAQKVRIVLMIDHASHIAMLENFNTTNSSSKPWPVFVKVDVGTSRAGIPLSERLRSVIQAVEASPATSLHGLYCHAGHSYSCCTPEDTAAVLDAEIASLIEGAAFVSPSRSEPLLLSLGSTPTAHMISTLDRKVPPNCILEVHGGNYPANDLQQLATGCISEQNQALRVIASVCSVYPERNEALINAGVIALSREIGRIEGYGCVVGKDGWAVKRLSQEHGILGLMAGMKGDAEEEFKLGDKILLYIQHACITAAAAGWYFVVDGEGIVREIWYPWKGW